MTACNVARNTDAEIREMLDRQFDDAVIDQIVAIVDDEMDAGTANPISDDIPRWSARWRATTAMMLSGDTASSGPRQRPCRAVCACSSSCGSPRCGAAPHAGRYRRYGHRHGAERRFAGKRCFFTGAASGIGRATALKLAAAGRRAVSDRPRRRRPGDRPSPTRARWAAQVAEHRALDISDYDEVAAFAADIHARHPGNGRGDEHRRRLGVGHRRPAHPSSSGAR